MASLKVGLMGCGQVAQSIHLKILTRLPQVEVIALAEPDPGRREKASSLAPKAIAFDNYQDLLTAPDLDAVVICLPPGLHADAAVAALEKKKHVYLEKPFATNLNEGKRILEAWKKAGIVGMVGFNYRRNKLYQATRECLQSGKLGGLVSARSVFSTPARTLTDWKKARLSGGGVLLDLASHHIDLVRFLFGQEVREIGAATRSHKSEADSAALQMQLESGVLVQSFFSLSAVEENRFEIYGDAGRLSVDMYLSLEVEISESTQKFARLKQIGRAARSLAKSSYILEKLRSPNREPSYQSSLTHFVEASLTGKPATPDFWDGYCNQAVLEAAEESARTGRVVSLTDLVPEKAMG